MPPKDPRSNVRGDGRKAAAEEEGPMFKGQLTDKERANWIRNGVTEAVAQNANATERKVDAALHKLDNLGEEDFAALRAKRLEDLKKKQSMMEEWKRKGHGVYQEISDQADFFSESKNNERLVCHFYRSTTWRCEIVDKHLALLAPKHMETRFVKINAEKCPFLIERLNIVLMPTIIMSKNNEAIDRIEGFDQLGGNDDFTTETMEKRLAFQEMIDYDEDLSDGITNVGKQFKMKQVASKRAEAGIEVEKPNNIKVSTLNRAMYEPDVNEIDWDN